VAARFEVSERCVRGLVRRQRESGSVAAKAHGGGALALATPEKLAALEARAATHNDHTIAEHHAHLLAAGHQQSASTVGRWLLGLGLTRKKRPAKTTKRAVSGSRACGRRGPGR
jgi:transposase